MPASSWALSRILAVAVEMAALVPPDGAVLKPCPSPKRSVSAGTTLTSSAGTPSSPATSWAYSDSLPSGSVVRLRTIFPVGCTRRNTARYASSAMAGAPRVGGRVGGAARALLVRGQGVVVLAVAERGLWAAGRVRRRRGTFAARVDAGLRHRLHPGVVRPRLGRFPLGIATELPATGVALAHGSSGSGAGASGTSRGAPRSAAIASATASRASRLWPLT